MNALLQVLVIMLSLLIVFVSFSPLCRMPGGLANLCHKLKYLLAMVSGLIFIYYAARGVAVPEMAIVSLTVFMFIWPRVLWWLRHRVADYVALHFPRFYFGFYLRAMAGMDRVFGR